MPLNLRPPLPPPPKLLHIRSPVYWYRFKPPPSTSDHYPRVHPARYPRGSTLQIHRLHGPPALGALPDQVAEVPSGNLALAPDFKRILARSSQLLDAGLQACTERGRGELQNLASFLGDAHAVGVGVVKGGERVGNAAGEARGERRWDRGEEIGCRQEDCFEKR